MAGSAAAKRQRRCMNENENDIAALPDDVVLQVFSRVGNVGDLFRFSLTCRWWLRRFTDPVFLRRLCPGQGEGLRRARLLGFFFFQQTRFELLPCSGRTKKKMRMAQRTSVSAPSFLPAPGSPLGHTDHRSLTSFVADDDGTFNYDEPLAARRGFVLMQLVPRTFHDDPHLLGLCNPITGERHLLPPLPECSGDLARRYDSYAIITATDTKQPLSPSSGRFKFSQLLLMTTQIKSDNMHLHSYSADTSSWWSTTTVCLDGSRFSMVGERSGVIHHGAAHWLCIDRPRPTRGDCLLYKLSAEVGTATARATLTKMQPIRGGGSPLLCVNGDGKLSVVCVYPLHATVWTQQQQGGECSGDDDDTPAAMWLRTAAFRMPIPMPAVPNPNCSTLCKPGEKCAWLGFESGSVLVLPRSGGVFVFDLEKKVVEKVMDCLLPLFSNESNPYIGERDGTCVAYELNLVDLFVLQLGGLCRRGSTE